MSEEINKYLTDEFFRETRNIVISSTGKQIEDRAICIVLYQYFLLVKDIAESEKWEQLAAELVRATPAKPLKPIKF